MSAFIRKPFAPKPSASFGETIVIQSEGGNGSMPRIRQLMPALPKHRIVQ